MKRFFQCDYHGATWWVVANDLEHAKKLLRSHECTWAGLPRELDWVEMTPERIAVTNCDRGDGSPVPLADFDCDIGDVFCSEY